MLSTAALIVALGSTALQDFPERALLRIDASVPLVEELTRDDHPVDGKVADCLQVKTNKGAQHTLRVLAGGFEPSVKLFSGGRCSGQRIEMADTDTRANAWRSTFTGSGEEMSVLLSYAGAPPAYTEEAEGYVAIFR